jgi:type VII secretion protein EccB
VASKRDLVEAHAYNRRRLVSAFLSGAPGGREVESVSRSRPVVAGVALGGLLVGGAAIAGLFTQPLPDGWDNGYVVIGKTSAARFVTIKGTLHPVLNATSARLILPSDKGFEVLVVDDDKIAATPHGSTLGILGAPDDLPPAGSLLQSGWVSCFDGTKPALTIGSATAPAYADASGLTVKVTGTGQDVRHLLAAGRRYAIPAGSYDSVKQYLGQLETPQGVTGTWVDLFTHGTDLAFDAFAFKNRTQVGQPLTGQYTLGNKLAKVGQLVVNKDQNDAMSVMVANGTIPLSAFAAAVYQAVAPDGLGKPVTVSNDDLARIQPSDTKGFLPEDWPTAVPSRATGTPCAVIETVEGKPATTHLATTSADSSFVKPPNKQQVYVQAGRGALVRASSTGTSGPVAVVDQSGQAFTITDPSAETLARLGYKDLTPRYVPPSWVSLLPAGPALSEAAVGAPRVEPSQ